MSTTAPRSRTAEGREFVWLLAVSMSMTALSIDLMIPAFPDIREQFGMEAGASKVSWIITAFFFGMASGPLLYGPASDRFGRRKPYFAGMTLYLIGAVGSALAPSFAWIIIFRFIWGLGAAGTRTIAVAAVRDRYSGEEMARLMSLMMAIFLIVPVVAPTVGAGVNAIGPWRLVFWIPAFAAVAMMLWARRLPETLPPERRLPFTPSALTGAAREVVTNRTTFSFVIAMTLLMGTMNGYLSSSELILEGVYDKGSWFPAFFGAIAVLLALGALNNARIVGRLGVRTIVRRFSIGALAATAALATLALVTDGRPNFWLFFAGVAIMLPLTQGLVPNCNTAAMVPVAHVAGTAAAIIATVTIGGSALLGGVLSEAFDRTTTPYSVGAFAFHVPAVALIWYVTSGARGRALDTPSTVAVPVE